MKCRHCGTALDFTLLDLGFAPPSNAYLTTENLSLPERYYPLKLKVCQTCWLVQTEDYARAADMFSADYAYFSSTSTTWLRHSEAYCKAIVARLGLNVESSVIEVASNDGYLLQYFQKRGIPCLGIEPTASTAAAAAAKGIEVLGEFFGSALARRLANEGRKADLIVGNNVFAHVPDINDFTNGLREVLKPEGTITLEFPHLLEMLANSQFDTVYHEHFSYLSLHTVSRIFKAAGLRVWDVEQLSTHGGSIRVYGCHLSSEKQQSKAVKAMLRKEASFGLLSVKAYTGFQQAAERIKDDLLSYLLREKRLGRRVVGYGAAAKGNTLLNYAGIKPDLLPYVCDAAESKQGKYLPGSHVPILHPRELYKLVPDSVLILPWNIADEVVEQQRRTAPINCVFMRAVPSLETIGETCRQVKAEVSLE